jgi:hypothetical protein
MFKVSAKPCDQCLFSKDRIVSAARVREVLSECQKKDTHFICHKTEDTCCRGFYDTRTSQLIRIAQRLNMVKFVAVTGEGK